MLALLRLPRRFDRLGSPPADCIPGELLLFGVVKERLVLLSRGVDAAEDGLEPELLLLVWLAKRECDAGEFFEYEVEGCGEGCFEFGLDNC